MPLGGENSHASYDKTSTDEAFLFQFEDDPEMGILGICDCNDGEPVGEGMLGRAFDEVIGWAGTMEEDFGRKYPGGGDALASWA
jgi:hypothetical protein